MIETALPKPATLIAVGLTEDDRLDDIFSRGADRIVLTEPDRDRADALTARFADSPPEVIVAAPVAGSESTPAGATLQTFNFPGLRSLARPNEALHSLFPGLRAQALRQIDTLAVADFLRQLGEVTRPAHLHLDLPGQELALLQAWANRDEASLPDVIVVRSASEPMFHGGSDAAELGRWAEQNGYQLTACDDRDPDWPWLQFRIDRTARALAQAKEEIMARDRHISELETALTECRSRAESDAAVRIQLDRDRRTALERAAQHGTRIAHLEGSLKESRAKIDIDAARIATIEAAHQTEKEAVQQARELAARRGTRATQLESALKESRDKIRAAEAQKAKLDEALDQSRSQLETAAAEKADLQAALEKSRAKKRAEADKKSAMKKRLAAAQRALKAAEENAEEQNDATEAMRADLGVALRMQTVLQSDLSSLRNRYKMVEASRAEQAALLQKLTPRLRQAAQELRHMGVPSAAPATTVLANMTHETHAAEETQPMEVSRDGRPAEQAPASDETAVARPAAKPTQKPIPGAKTSPRSRAAPKAKPAAKTTTKAASDTARSSSVPASSAPTTTASRRKPRGPKTGKKS